MRCDIITNFYVQFLVKIFYLIIKLRTRKMSFNGSWRDDRSSCRWESWWDRVWSPEQARVSRWWWVLVFRWARECASPPDRALGVPLAPPQSSRFERAWAEKRERLRGRVEERGLGLDEERWNGRVGELGCLKMKVIRWIKVFRHYLGWNGKLPHSYWKSTKNVNKCLEKLQNIWSTI